MKPLLGNGFRVCRQSNPILKMRNTALLTKVCFRCHQDKLISEFYRHSQMKDGHLNKCKECTKNDANKHRSENIEKIREYDRERGKQEHRIANSTRSSAAWRSADKRRASCHNKVRWALQSGTLQKLPCERCKNPKSLAHHEDYGKPLDVIWLCQPCHKQRHKEIDSELRGLSCQ